MIEFANALMQTLENMGATPEQVKPLAEYIVSNVDLTAQEINLLQCDDKPQAVKSIRDRTSLGIIATKCIVDRFIEVNWPLNHSERRLLEIGASFYSDTVVQSLSVRYNIAIEVARSIVTRSKE